MARGDRAALEGYLKRFRMKEEEFFALDEGAQRARLGIDASEELIKPSAEVAKAADALRAEAKSKAAAAPKAETAK